MFPVAWDHPLWRVRNVNNSQADRRMPRGAWQWRMFRTADPCAGRFSRRTGLAGPGSVLARSPDIPFESFILDNGFRVVAHLPGGLVELLRAIGATESWFERTNCFQIVPTSAPEQALANTADTGRGEPLWSTASLPRISEPCKTGSN